MTEVIRKVYDPDGTESVLGLPCRTVVEEFDGEVQVGNIHIQDAFNVNEINITDDHSTGVMPLLAKIVEVKMQERCILSDIRVKIYGYPIKEDGTIDTDVEMVEDTLTEVNLSEPFIIDGIKVDKILKVSGNYIYAKHEVQVIMDNRSTMDGYKIEGAAECAMKLITKEDLPFDDEKISGGLLFSPKLNLGKSILVGFYNETIGDIVAEYPEVVNIIVKNPKSFDVIVEWPQVLNNLINTGKKNWLVTNGNAYINTGFIPNYESTVIADMFVSKTPVSAWFGAATSRSDFGFGVYNGNYTLWHNYNNDINIGAYIEGEYHIEKRKNVLWLNGEIKHTSEVSNTFTCTQPMFIFAMPNPSGVAARIASAISNFRFAKFDIYDNKTKVREFVPYIHNNKSGLIDLLTGDFYESQGTGLFTIITENV